MEDLTIIILTAVLGTFGLLITWMCIRFAGEKSRVHTEEIRERIEDDRRRAREREEDRRDRRASAEAARSPGRSPEPEEAEGQVIGEWAVQIAQEFLQIFGIDPDVIFEETAPPGVEQGWPIAKGVLISKAKEGLPGLLSMLGGGQPPPGGMETPPEGSEDHPGMEI